MAAISKALSASDEKNCAAIIDVKTFFHLLLCFPRVGFGRPSLNGLPLLLKWVVRSAL